MATSPIPPISAPPTAPSVAAQQGGPMSQFLAAQQQGNPQGAPPLALVQQKLNESAAALKDVARVLIMSKPALMPILQKMIQAGSMLMDAVNQELQGGQAAPPPAGQDDSQAMPDGGAPGGM